MKLVKDVLAPGVYRKNDEELVLTENDIEQIFNSVSALESNQYRIPLWLEHPFLSDRLAYPVRNDNAEMVQSVESDPWFAGWLSGAFVDDAHMLHVEMDIPNEELGMRLEKIGTYVSPQFGRNDSFDSNIAKETPFGLHHVALTRNPVNKNQSNKFHKKNSEVGLDDLSGVSHTPIQVKQMSLTDACKQGIESFRFSLSDIVTNVPNASNANLDVSGTATNNNVDQAANLKTKLQAALQALGVTMAPDSAVLDDADGMSRLLSVLADVEGDAINKANAASSGGNTDPYSEQSTVIAMSTNNASTNDGKGTSTGTVAVVPPQAPTGVQAPSDHPAVDPVQFSEMKSALVNQDQIIKSQTAQIAGLTNLVTNQRKEAYQSRIRQLSETGRITVDQAKALEAQVGTYQFSATASSDQQSSLDVALGIYESLPIGAQIPLSGQQMSQQGFQETGILSMGTSLSRMGESNDVSEERANEIMKEYCNLANNFDMLVTK